MFTTTMAAALAVLIVTPFTGSADTSGPHMARTLSVGPGGQYATVQAAADAAQPGDTVAIAAGVYNGGLVIRHDGSPGRPITFLGVGGDAIITGGSGDKGLIAIGNHSWLRFTNVTSAGSRGFGAYASGAHDLVFDNFHVDGSQDGGLVLLATTNVVVDGCDIRGTNARGTSADHEALSIGSGSSNVEVKHCLVHDNGEEGIDVKYNDNAHVRVHDNVVRNNRGPNIYVDSSSFVDVYDNFTSGTKNNTKAGIGLAVEDYSDSRKLGNVKVYNNVSYGNAQAGLGMWVESTGTMSDIQIVNNTFYGNSRGSVTVDGDKFSGCNIMRNNIFAEGAVSDTHFTKDHNLSGDPGFVNPSAGDFRLRPGSTKAIDVGSGVAAPAFDLAGTARPAGAGFDIGAYEQ